MPRRRTLITALTALALFLLLLHVNRSRNDPRHTASPQNYDVEPQHAADHIHPSDHRSPQRPDPASDLTPPPPKEPLHIFAFGDSYTSYHLSTFPSPYTQQTPSSPSASNPWGTRASFPLSSSLASIASHYNLNISATPLSAQDLVAGTPKWLDYLIIDWGLTGGGIEGTRAWNSARGASTVDGDLIPPQFWGAKSLVDQASECMDTVGSGEAWMLSRKGVGSATEAGEMEGDMSERSIFIFWFGINDVANTAEDHGADELEILYEKVVESYVGVLERLYEHGGRWFVVLGVPPIERTPQLLAKGHPHTTAIIRARGIFNSLLEDGVKAWARSKTLAKLNFLDTALLFNEMLDSEPENARCTSEESRECLWVDGFHPGERFQRAVAVEVGSVVREMVGI